MLTRALRHVISTAALTASLGMAICPGWAPARGDIVVTPDAASKSNFETDKGPLTFTITVQHPVTSPLTSISEMNINVDKIVNTGGEADDAVTSAFIGNINVNPKLLTFDLIQLKGTQKFSFDIDYYVGDSKFDGDADNGQWRIFYSIKGSDEGFRGPIPFSHQYFVDVTVKDLPGLPEPSPLLLGGAMALAAVAARLLALRRRAGRERKAGGP